MSISWLSNIPSDRLTNSEALAAVEAVQRAFKLLDDDPDVKASLHRAQVATRQFEATSNVKTVLYEVRKYLTNGPVPTFPAAEGTETQTLVNKSREHLICDVGMNQSQAHNVMNTLPSTRPELVAICRAMDFELKSYDQVHAILGVINELREHFVAKLGERQLQQAQQQLERQQKRQEKEKNSTTPESSTK